MRTWWKKRKCWLPAFSPFPTIHFTLSKTNFLIRITFKLFSANNFSLAKCTFFSSLIVYLKVYRFEEDFQAALEGFSKASQLDPGWKEPEQQEKSLMNYLTVVTEMIEAKVIKTMGDGSG